MEVAEVHRLVDSIVALTDADAGDAGDQCVERSDLEAALGELARVSAWCQGQQVQLTQLLASVASYPEQSLAGAARVGLAKATKLVERAGTAEQAPALGAALLDGAVSGEHLDAVTRAVRDVEPHHRAALTAKADALADVAAVSTPDEFARRLRLEARRLEADDGTTRFERQRRNTRLRTWFDATTGMFHLAGEFDPLSGVRIAARLDAAVAALFAEQTPPDCPSDPLAKNNHLRALALLALIGEPGGQACAGASPGSGGTGRPEITVVIDTRCTDPLTDRPVVDWGLPVELPWRVLVDLAGTADVHGVIVRNGVVLHAPGVLDLGRNTRVANRAQRRALRALHPTCAVPGCTVRFDLCKIHHILWWRHGGATDLRNLLPLCIRHHHDVHDNGWQLQLTRDRALTVTLPDGTVLATGPPRRRPG